MQRGTKPYPGLHPNAAGYETCCQGQKHCIFHVTSEREDRTVIYIIYELGLVKYFATFAL